MGTVIKPEHKPFVDFIFHIIFGAVAFLIIFLIAVGMSSLAQHFENDGRVSVGVMIVMKFGEIAAFALDLGLYLLFSAAIGLRFIAEVLKRS